MNGAATLAVVSTWAPRWYGQTDGRLARPYDWPTIIDLSHKRHDYRSEFFVELTKRLRLARQNLAKATSALKMKSLAFHP